MASNASTSVSLDESTFREVLGRIVAAPEESRWREIPWQTDIRDACRIAAETGKPIFLWAMNGNPLGCT